MFRPFVVGLVLLSSHVGAEPFDWHKLSNQKQMHIAFVGAAKQCAGIFGFKQLPAPTQAMMADKIDAYLLLQDNADENVQKWALFVLKPIHAVGAEKSEGLDEEDERRAAAAAVAASENPEVYDEAKARYSESALGPFRRALAACSLGAEDPFIGKYYWSGTGSTEKIEQSIDASFSELVEHLKKPQSK